MAFEMKTWKLAMIGSLLLLIGCAYTKPLTPKGGTIRVVSEKDRDDACRIIDVVIGAHDFGSDVADDLRSAMNEAKNLVAEKGGNAMRILSVQSVSTWIGFSSGASTVTAEALKCDMSKLK